MRNSDAVIYCSYDEIHLFKTVYTVAGKAIGFALEQPLRDATLVCPASGILKQLEYKTG
ncbi:MAG: hypothetical protein LBJ00_12850 [Planctomycetaceae bacterium]|nr:hypothetical protein [Planctomycetaceae bacterium]